MDDFINRGCELNFIVYNSYKKTNCIVIMETKTKILLFLKFLSISLFNVFSKATQNGNLLNETG